MLVIKNLKHIYGKTSIAYPDWEVSTGDHAVILGSSGCGKTTLLHLIGGLMKPTQGTLEVDGENLATKSQNMLDRYRGQNIGIVFQKPHLVRSLTVKENLLLSQWLGGKGTSSWLAEETLNHLGILYLKNRKVYQISEGQAQRVSIARAVINAPKLLLADEPTASLDEKNCEKVMELLQSQAKQMATTLIIATHDLRVTNKFQNQLKL